MVSGHPVLYAASVSSRTCIVLLIFGFQLPFVNSYSSHALHCKCKLVTVCCNMLLGLFSFADKMLLFLISEYFYCVNFY